MKGEKRTKGTLGTAGMGLAWVFVLLLFPSVARAQVFLPILPPRLPDPIPIRRVQVPASWINRVLDATREGAWVRMSRSEFEALVQKAALAADAQANPPVLVEARYQARLEDNGLLGSAHWIVQHPAKAGAGFLSIRPFSLAITGVRIDNQPGIVGDPDGTGPKLILAKPGRHTVDFDWSARGEQGPTGYRFNLRIPSCALCSLDLDLPLERVPSLGREGGLVLGPFPAEKPNRRRWRIEATGWSQLDLVLRSTEAAKTPPVLLGKLRTSETLATELRTVDMELLLEVLEGSVSEFDCFLDRQWTPITIQLRNGSVESWRVEDGPPGQKRLHIKLPDPLQSGVTSVRISCIALRQKEQPWSAANLDLLGGSMAAHEVTLQLDPGLHFQDWSPGPYQLVRLQQESSGAHTLVLRKSLVPAEGQKAASADEAPTARISADPVEATARLEMTWRPGVRESLLYLEGEHHVVRGTAFSLALRIPSGWTVDRVETRAPRLTHTWNILPEGEGHQRLVISLPQGIAPATTVRYGVFLRATVTDTNGSDGKAARTVQRPFPVVEAIEVKAAQGTLAIQTEPGRSVSIVEAPDPSATLPLDSSANKPRSNLPWPGGELAYLFHFQGKSPRGKVLIGTQATSASREGEARAEPEKQLHLPDTPHKSDAAQAAWSNVQIQVHVQRGDWQRLHFRGKLTAWNEAQLKIDLPQTARLRSAAVDGVELTYHLALSDGNAIPWPGGVESHRLDLVYECPAKLGCFWSRLQPVVPAFPVSPERVSWTWNLPGRLMPLSSTAVSAIDPEPRPAWPYVLSALDLGQQEVPRRTLESRLGRIRKAVEDARPRLEASLKSRAEWTLGELIETLVFEGLRGQEVMLIDREALASVGKSPATALTGNFSILPDTGNDRLLLQIPSADLVAVSMIQGIVLTTRLQWEEWALAAPQSGLPRALKRPLEAAMLTGRDPSGRFVLASNWLEAKPQEGIAPFQEASDLDPEFRLWQQDDGSPESAGLWLIDLWGVDVLAMGIAALYLLICFIMGRHFQWKRFRAWLVFVSVCGAVTLLAPPALKDLGRIPGIAGLLLGLLVFLRVGFRKVLPRQAVLVASAASVLLLALLPGQAAAPQDNLVWILPGTGNTPDAVLASPALLDQLRGLSARPPYHLDGAVLSGAEYVGTLRGELVDLQITYRLYCFSETTARLAVPLSGVELIQATLDGQPAYPEALAPPAVGYVLPVQGRGFHTLVLQAQARATTSEQDTELRLSIPELVQSRVSLTLPASSGDPLSLFARGVQRIERDREHVRLSADMGRTTQMQLRWRGNLQTAAPALPKLSEIYYWDLQESTPRLLASWRYLGLRENRPQLSWLLPDDLDVRHVEPRTGAATPAARVRAWHVERTPQGKKLSIELSRLASATVQLQVELVRTGLLQSSEKLNLPAPVNVESEPTLVAFRAPGLQTGIESRGLTGVEAQAFALSWQASRGEELGPPDAAFRFLRAAVGVPSLQLTLQRKPAPAQANHEIQYRLLPQFAELTATLRLTRSVGAWNVVEWDVPASMQVLDVQGSDVWTWMRTARGVQAWLSRPRSQVTLEWSARLDGNAQGDFALTGLPIREAQDVRTSLKVTTESAFLVEARDLGGLTATMASSPTPNERSYQAATSSWHGTFRTVAAPLRGEAQTLKAVRLQDNQVEWRVLLRLQVQQGDGRQVRVRLKHEPSFVWQVSARGLASVKTQRISDSDIVYLLHLESGNPLESWILLQGKAPNTQAPVRPPEVTADGFTIVDRWIGVREQDWQLENPLGMTRALDPMAVLRRWAGRAPEVLEADSSIWRVDRPDVLPAFQPRPAREAASAFEVLHVEQGVCFSPGSGWRQHCAIWGYQERASLLRITMPAGARIHRVEVNGQPHSDWQRDGDDLVIALHEAGPHGVSVHWETEPSSLAFLEVTAPAMQRSLEAATNRLISILVPPGRTLERASASVGDTLELTRVAALLKISERLARKLADHRTPVLENQLLAMQTEFYRQIRDLDYAARAQLGLQRSRPVGRDARLQDALDANVKLAETNHFEEIRARAEQMLLSSATTIAGVARSPLRGVELEGPGTLYVYDPPEGETVSRLHFLATEEQEPVRVLLWLSLGLLGFGLAWMLPHYPLVIARLWLVWPETLILAVLVVRWASGSWLLAGVLVLPAILGRAFDLHRRYQIRLAQASLEEGPSSGGVATTDSGT